MRKGLTMGNPIHAAMPWRWVVIISSFSGIAGIVLLRSRVGGLTMPVLLLPIMPFAVGCFAAAANVSLRARILFLWLAAAISSCVAVITILSGVGIIVLGVTSVYLVAAGMLNETREPTDS